MQTPGTMDGEEVLDNAFTRLLLGRGDGVYVICACLRVARELQEDMFDSIRWNGQHKKPIGRCAQCAAVSQVQNGAV